jgi:hypothetical protein
MEPFLVSVSAVSVAEIGDRARALPTMSSLVGAAWVSSLGPRCSMQSSASACSGWER